jgi:hypothetical protein
LCFSLKNASYFFKTMDLIDLVGPIDKFRQKEQRLPWRAVGKGDVGAGRYSSEHINNDEKSLNPSAYSDKSDVNGPAHP